MSSPVSTASPYNYSPSPLNNYPSQGVYSPLSNSPHICSPQSNNPWFYASSPQSNLPHYAPHNHVNAPFNPVFQPSFSPYLDQRTTYIEQMLQQIWINQQNNRLRLGGKRCPHGLPQPGLDWWGYPLSDDYCSQCGPV
ncbi:hypothetical protein BAUCODRAFT_475088 [Baudoinia panamericana UAMH 10762]|uniref:Uncharacterized protein n=1 Tax=Baudoinia panamericana (strain UAMH 10762) TaxID=717646 RepID=M2NBB5_BAUPA|nr:uncharacterized protein BAUCODRAFT_475088 [Baudoinia panamericana UAMH 10762]EMC96444.1 hypothetical protein BAUCODRAFT_475088 [Baudoinia panamericana UAMH 10762]